LHFLHGGTDSRCVPSDTLPWTALMGALPSGSYHRGPEQKTTTEEFTMTTASGHTEVIRAKKVIGTSVKNSAGEKIGQIEDIVLDKLSNNIVYAVVGFGGFLGVNEKFHPVPWSALDYVESEESYVVPFTKSELEAAPADSLDKLTKGDGAAAYSKSAKAYYKVS
jgi:sporulation protein YlmC with PRC-barrel domain